MADLVNEEKLNEEVKIENQENNKESEKLEVVGYEPYGKSHQKMEKIGIILTWLGLILAAVAIDSAAFGLFKGLITGDLNQTFFDVAGYSGLAGGLSVCAGGSMLIASDIKDKKSNKKSKKVEEELTEENKDDNNLSI